MFIREIGKNQDLVDIMGKYAKSSEAQVDKKQGQEHHKNESNRMDMGVNISEEGLKKYQEQIQSKRLEEMYKEVREDAETIAEESKDMTKLLIIASRIANGDKVPFSDEKKLLEENPKLYHSAKTLSSLNADKKHKRYKSLYEDEEQVDNQEDKSKLDEEIMDLDMEQSGNQMSEESLEEDYGNEN